MPYMAKTWSRRQIGERQPSRDGFVPPHFHLQPQMRVDVSGSWSAGEKTRLPGEGARQAGDMVIIPALVVSVFLFGSTGV